MAGSRITFDQPGTEVSTASPLPVTISGSAMGGAVGSPAPTTASLIGGTDGTNLRAATMALLNGVYRLNVTTGAAGLTGSATPAIADLLGASDGTNLRALSTTLVNSKYRLDVNLEAGSTVTSATSSALNTDLLTGTVNGWFPAANFHTASLQITGSAGISAGAIIFEQTNDITAAAAGNVWPVDENTLLTPTPQIAAITIAASTTRMFSAPIQAAFVRVRISTAFVGGTVQIAASFSTMPYTREVVTVHQATAANLNVTATLSANTPTLAAGTNLAGDFSLQYRAGATGAASGAHIVAAATTNATVVKASAGKVIGWQLQNTTAAIVYVKLHNTTTAPTAGAGVVRTIGIPANGKSEVSFEAGIAFTTGIGLTIVTGAADTDATAVAANAVVGDLFFA